MVEPIITNMFFREYAPYLELGGLLLALLEFLGVGDILRKFIQWQGEQFRFFIEWIEGDTEIELLKTRLNNINYFYLLFTLISLYVFFVKASVEQFQITTMVWFVLVVTYIGLYLFIWKVLIPIVQFMLGLYYWILGILCNKGVLTIIGLLVAVTSFVVSNAVTPSATPVTEQELKVEQPKEDVENGNSKTEGNKK